MQIKFYLTIIFNIYLRITHAFISIRAVRFVFKGNNMKKALESSCLRVRKALLRLGVTKFFY